MAPPLLVKPQDDTRLRSILDHMTEKARQELQSVMRSFCLEGFTLKRDDLGRFTQTYEFNDVWDYPELEY